MNAMERQHLDIPVNNHSSFKNISTILTPLQDFSLHQTSCEIEELIFKPHWKGS